MALRSGWRRLGTWVIPNAEKTLKSVIVIGAYLIGIFGLIVGPLSLLTAIAKHAGTTDGRIVHLTPLGDWLVAALMGATFLWSITVGGFAKACLTRQHLQLMWLFLFGLGLLAGLSMMFDQMRGAMAAFAADQHGDNPKFAGFIAFWILMVGYAGKAVWDEPRDRVGKWLEPICERMVSAFGSPHKETSADE
ncbi:hypothetical protein ACM61V_18475 [Sphingomonas sp. TX0543]|uniref:hypothetical protein n=1 Tax=Sphingomonadales TaxID=204457 RepID=UPI0011B24E20|nr:hypothetical protein [Sphingomonas fennica]